MRHSFKDELDRTTTPEEAKKALMGHSDSGTTRKYGTKKAPRPVDIHYLKEIVDGLNWKFLKEVRSTFPQQT
ncbi:MAG: hypothetical protein EON58_16840 [Alphaproteobacteria bacterium]|nr:MAG: hypothetical protein EON58_16840 [Alphaproteobacteria bacterium]